ncbi:MAG: FHA domain-containing protein [Pseudomonadota bacterium]
MEAQAQSHLLLQDEQQALTVSPTRAGAQGISLGKSTTSDFVFCAAHTSRQHARIVYRNNDYFLVDESTNGTFVQTEDQAVVHLHRDELRLWGSGWISLGEPLHKVNPIAFNAGTARS